MISLNSIPDYTNQIEASRKNAKKLISKILKDKNLETYTRGYINMILKMDPVFEEASECGEGYSYDDRGKFLYSNIGPYKYRFIYRNPEHGSKEIFLGSVIEGILPKIISVINNE